MQNEDATGPSGETGRRMQAQLLLEKVSGAIEANPGETLRTIRVRSGVPRRSVELAIEWLQREGYVARDRSSGEWRYRSIAPYRARREAGHDKHYR